MINDSHLDKLFEDQLSGYQSYVPEDMWERIVRKKNEDRKGFLFFFRLFGLFMLGIGFAVYLLFNFDKKTSVIEINKLSENKKGTFQNSIQIQNPNKFNYPLQVPLAQTSYGRKRRIQKQGLQNPNIGGFQSFKERPSARIQTQTKQDSANSSNEEAITTDSTKADESKIKSESIPNRKQSSADSTQNIVLKKAEKNEIKKNKKWWLDLYVSPDYPINPGTVNETMKLSYTIGLTINHSFGAHFSGKTGIQFSQINYSLTDSNSEHSLNHLKSLDLPLLAGYSMGNETLGMTINAGVVFNLYSWFQGDSPNYFKTNTGLSLYLGIDLEKNINDHISVFGEPYYRYRLTPMTVNSVNFNKFIDVVGLSLGARYYFNK
jgi:hypothetical protein